MACPRVSPPFRAHSGRFALPADLNALIAHHMTKAIPAVCMAVWTEGTICKKAPTPETPAITMRISERYPVAATTAGFLCKAPAWMSLRFCGPIEKIAPAPSPKPVIIAVSAKLGCNMFVSSSMAVPTSIEESVCPASDECPDAVLKDS